MKPLSFTLLLALLAGTSVRAQTPLGTFAEIENPTSPLALSDGRVLVDTIGQIVAFAPDGTSLGPFNPAGLDTPLAQLADGRVLIRQHEDLLVFEPDGTFVGVFAENLDVPVAATQLADGRVLVAEQRGFDQNGRISAFDPDGTPLPPFVRVQDAGPYPSAIAQLADGRVLVLYEDGGFGVQAYAPDRTPLGPFVTDETLGLSGDLLQLPDGRVLIANVSGFTLPENERGQAHLFTPEGERLGPFTEGIQSPSALALLADGRVLVASQREDRIYAYGVVPVASEPVPEANQVVTTAYPSPIRAGESARLGLTLGAPAEVSVAVHDAAGREVSRETHALGAGEQSVEIETAGLAAGVYAVRVSGAGLSATRRLVVVR